MGERTVKGKPNPGSREAIEAGCSCPILDNANGRGYMGVSGVFVYREGCPVHWRADVPLPSEATIEGEVKRGK